MDGTTVMGPPSAGIYSGDVDYDSRFLLLTRTFDRHRLSLRYDTFHMADDAFVPDDDNGKAGLAWTLPYRYTVLDRLAVAAEWFSIKTSAAACPYFDLEPTATKTQWRLDALLSFSR